jgi:carbon storage regulator CsrA
MLVLSRRPDEKILLPSVRTTIQVVSVKGSVVRLGIEAPPDITVLRGELQPRTPERRPDAPTSASNEACSQALRHLIRNRLNGATIGLALLRQQVLAGRLEDVERTFALIQQELQMLQQNLDNEATKAPAPAPRPAPRARKALLVEDDRNECELLAGFLRMSGFTVTTAGDGCDALDYLRTGEKPDVVLLDMGLPRCDGMTTAKEIRRNPSCAGLKIFAVTGRSPEDFGLTPGPNHIDRWFNKPIDPVVLLRELTQELGPS